MNSRAWCFTLNNYTEEDVNLFRELECTYLVCGREVAPQTGMKHLQGYVYFKNARKLGGMKLIHRNCHWEVSKGTAEQNRIYCTKENDYFETGIQPMSQKRKGEVEQDRWGIAWKKAKEGNIEDIDPDIKFRFYKTCKDIARDHMTKASDLEELTNYWIYGPPGVGKSRLARQDYPNAYFKCANKWWDGYQGEESVIIDDFELDHKCLGHYIKIWADRYSFIAEYKGGSMHIRPKNLIITSNYSIDQVFASDPTMAQAIKRRFRVMNCPFPLEFKKKEIEDLTLEKETGSDEGSQSRAEEDIDWDQFSFNDELFDTDTV